ncbi:MAG TPA: hypothetical protein DEP84_26510 [Chloroflexi bacterium]|nr:hypothetical protein [Chloroflexota bacterium]
MGVVLGGAAGAPQGSESVANWLFPLGGRSSPRGLPGFSTPFEEGLDLVAPFLQPERKLFALRDIESLAKTAAQLIQATIRYIPQLVALPDEH